MKSPVLAFLALVIAVLLAIGAWQQFGGAGGKTASKSGGAHASGHPRLFDERSFDEAKSAASAEGKILLIKFTADWCGPCKHMDATTFVDSRVEAWVGKAAIATVVDVDRDPAIAQKYRISAMPTMVALRGDKEIDRVQGALPPDAFLEWGRKLESK